MLEKNCEKFLKNGVKKLGGLCYKFVSPGNAGVPDRIVMIDGLTIFVELKRDIGKLSALQKIQIKKLLKAGQRIEVLYGLDEVKDFLGRLRSEQAKLT